MSTDVQNIYLSSVFLVFFSENNVCTSVNPERDIPQVKIDLGKPSIDAVIKQELPDSYNFL